MFLQRGNNDAQTGGRQFTAATELSIRPFTQKHSPFAHSADKTLRINQSGHHTAAFALRRANA